MAFTSGAATDHQDLLNRLRKFLLGLDEVHSSVYTGTGNGTMSAPTLGASAVTETWTVQCVTAAANGGTFSVTGSKSGAQANASVGVEYVSAFLNFTISDGTTDFIVGDKWVIEVVASDIPTAWTQLEWTPGGSLTALSTLKVRGPGAGAGKEVFVNIRTYTDATNSQYSWEIRQACAYSASAPWGGQLSESPANAYLNLWENSISYWFYANDRRVIVVAKTGTNYTSAHAGFFLPWGTPAQHPFPIYVAGDYNVPVAYSFNNASRRHCFDPGNSNNDATANGWARSSAGVWYPTSNHWNSSLNNNVSGREKGSRGHIWPYASGYGSGNAVGQYQTLPWNGGSGTNDASWGGEYFAPTQQGERCLIPLMIVGGDEGPMGAIDGAYAVGGSGLAPEMLITIGARNFRCFQNIQRNSPDDFYCVEEI